MHALRTYIKKNTFLIVLYHDISPERFDSHLQHLRNHYAFISLEEVEAIYSAKNCTIPANCAFINFDDGLKENYNLLPVIKKHEIRPTVFLTAGLVAKEYQNRPILNSEEIRTMSAWVDFQSHGVTHAVMPKCSNQELHYELTHSKKILEEISGQRCFAIAYPNGQCAKREIEAARTAGFLIGREAARRGLNDCRTNPLVLKRISARPDDSPDDLERSIIIAELNYLMERFSKQRKIQ